MKIWSRIVAGIYIIAGIFLAFFFLTMWATAEKSIIDNLPQYIRQHISAIGFAGMFIIIAGIVWTVNWFDYMYRTKVVSFDNPGGKIKIFLRAIEDYVQSMLIKQIQGMKSVRVKAGMSSKGLETKITLKLLSNMNIPEVCTNVQEVTKNYLQDAVGVERISNIEVIVTSIKAGDYVDEYEDITEQSEEEEHREEAEDTAEQEKG